MTKVVKDSNQIKQSRRAERRVSSEDMPSAVLAYNNVNIEGVPFFF